MSDIAATPRPTATSGRSLRRFLLRLLWFVTTVAPVFWLVPQLDAPTLGNRLGHPVVQLLLLAALLNLAGQVVQAGCWSVLLRPRHRVPFARLLRYEFAAQSTAYIDVPRGGDPLRSRLLSRQNVPTGVTGALITLRRIVRAAAIGVLAIAAPLLMAGLPGWVTAFIWSSTVATVALVGLLVWLAHRDGGERAPRGVRRVAEGLFCLRSPRTLLLLVVLVLLGVVIDTVAAVVILSALHVHGSVGVAALVLFFVDVSVSLPVTPVHLGTFEAGAFFSLQLAHVPLEAGAAFALVFHAQQNLPQLIAGLPLRFAAGQPRREDHDSIVELGAQP
ncbi:flippase-like domain-containing protein [Micromonospora sp. R77]|uniref:lysylphosphatidylglycerol synthase transmembrane domain-containing protein n=1 Tax=Micromonospora sp. R77 TaxID=2925836 RepID=UPI001F605519|nr:lysylphosphatidylglycerol synthase transmembrane domain-containing protein [Micromonospora sp. R77]MCI4066216.1 flippase-like domain-containing protein [Micromonospora sp. R77]